MQKSREPDPGLKGYQSALDLTARVGAAVVAMVGPGLAGQWLDQRWGTGFLALLGFLFGIPLGIYYLLLMSGTLPPKWGKVPEHRSTRKSPPNADNASDRDTSQPQPATSKLATLIQGGVALVLVLAVAAAALAAYANSRHGMPGIQSVLLAFGVCAVAGISAYAIAVYSVGTPNAMAGLMGGMMFRTGLPIVAGMVGSNTSPQLQAVGFMGHCMLLFLVGLISEVILNVRLIQSAERRRSAAQPSSTNAGNHIASVL